MNRSNSTSGHHNIHTPTDDGDDAGIQQTPLSTSNAQQEAMQPETEAYDEAAAIDESEHIHSILAELNQIKERLRDARSTRSLSNGAVGEIGFGDGELTEFIDTHRGGGHGSVEGHEPPRRPASAASHRSGMSMSTVGMGTVGIGGGADDDDDSDDGGEDGGDGGSPSPSAASWFEEAASTSPAHTFEHARQQQQQQQQQQQGRWPSREEHYQPRHAHQPRAPTASDARHPTQFHPDSRHNQQSYHPGHRYQGSRESEPWALGNEMRDDGVQPADSFSPAKVIQQSFQPKGMRGGGGLGCPGSGNSTHSHSSAHGLDASSASTAAGGLYSSAPRLSEKPVSSHLEEGQQPGPRSFPPQSSPPPPPPPTQRVGTDGDLRHDLSPRRNTWRPNLHQGSGATGEGDSAQRAHEKRVTRIMRASTSLDSFIVSKSPAAVPNIASDPASVQKWVTGLRFLMGLPPLDDDSNKGVGAHSARDDSPRSPIMSHNTTCGRRSYDRDLQAPRYTRTRSNGSNQGGSGSSVASLGSPLRTARSVNSNAGIVDLAVRGGGGGAASSASAAAAESKTGEADKGGGDDEGGEGAKEQQKRQGKPSSRVESFAPYSLCCLGKGNPLRSLCISIELDPLFHQLIFAAILYNTVLLGMADYGHVVTSPADSPLLGELDPTTSTRNYIIDKSETPLVLLYAAEMSIRIVAMGLWCYLSDYWNVLDFVVSVAGLVQIAGSFGGGTTLDLSFLRTFRVLRPLRFIQKLKGMRVLVHATIAAVPELLAVLGLCLFVFVLFGIMAVQLFAGVFTARCRLTPWPVTREWVPGLDVHAHRCLVKGKVVDNFSTQAERPLWQKADSPWSQHQVGCFWPVDEEDERTCDLDDLPWDNNGGRHACYHDTVLLPASEWRWCGSNFDARGNDRFGVLYNFDDAPRSSSSSSSSSGDIPNDKDSAGYFALFDRELQRREVDALAGTYAEGFNWALTNFDSFPEAFVTIFQVITLEGWTLVQYMAMDATGSAAAFFFLVLVLIGSFFVLNLVLAVLESSFTEARDAEKAAQLEHLHEKELQKHLREVELMPMMPGSGSSSSSSSSNTGASDFLSENHHTDDTISRRISQSFFFGLFGNNSAKEKSSVDSEDGGKKSDKRKKSWAAEFESQAFGLLGWLEAPPTSAWRVALQHSLLEQPTFERFVLFLIVANTVTLACDRYPLDPNEASVLELINLVLTLVFALEALLKGAAYGLYGYLSATENAVDFLIVVTSLAELAVVPPALFGGEASGDGGALTAFRCMRLFRIFKMAKKWEAMQDLMTKFQKTISDVSNVALLMFLLMYIFALLGMQLFANNLHFNELGFAVKIGDAQWADATIPRSNFDSFAWAFITIFQVLTGEDWNVVMYDCWRAAGDSAVVYFFFLLVIGMFVVLNLFLAILLSNFAGSDDDDEVSELGPEEGNKEGRGKGGEYVDEKKKRLGSSDAVGDAQGVELTALNKGTESDFDYEIDDDGASSYNSSGGEQEAAWKRKYQEQQRCGQGSARMLVRGESGGLVSTTAAAAAAAVGDGNSRVLYNDEDDESVQRKKDRMDWRRASAEAAAVAQVTAECYRLRLRTATNNLELKLGLVPPQLTPPLTPPPEKGLPSSPSPSSPRSPSPSSPLRTRMTSNRRTSTAHHAPPLPLPRLETPYEQIHHSRGHSKQMFSRVAPTLMAAGNTPNHDDDDRGLSFSGTGRSGSGKKQLLAVPSSSFSVSRPNNNAMVGRSGSERNKRRNSVDSSSFEPSLSPHSLASPKVSTKAGWRPRQSSSRSSSGSSLLPLLPAAGSFRGGSFRGETVGPQQKNGRRSRSLSSSVPAAKGEATGTALARVPSSSYMRSTPSAKKKTQRSKILDNENAGGRSSGAAGGLLLPAKGSGSFRSSGGGGGAVSVGAWQRSASPVSNEKEMGPKGLVMTAPPTPLFHSPSSPSFESSPGVVAFAAPSSSSSSLLLGVGLDEEFVSGATLLSPSAHHHMHHHHHHDGDSDYSDIGGHDTGGWFVTSVGGVHFKCGTARRGQQKQQQQQQDVDGAFRWVPSLLRLAHASATLYSASCTHASFSFSDEVAAGAGSGGGNGGSGFAMQPQKQQPPSVPDASDALRALADCHELLRHAAAAIETAELLSAEKASLAMNLKVSQHAWARAQQREIQLEAEVTTEQKRLLKLTDPPAAAKCKGGGKRVVGIRRNRDDGVDGDDDNDDNADDNDSQQNDDEVEEAPEQQLLQQQQRDKESEGLALAIKAQRKALKEKRRNLTSCNKAVAAAFSEVETVQGEWRRAAGALGACAEECSTIEAAALALVLWTKHALWHGRQLQLQLQHSNHHQNQSHLPFEQHPSPVPPIYQPPTPKPPLPLSLPFSAPPLTPTLNVNNNVGDEGLRVGKNRDGVVVDSSRLRDRSHSRQQQQQQQQQQSQSPHIFVEPPSGGKKSTDVYNSDFDHVDDVNYDAPAYKSIDDDRFDSNDYNDDDASDNDNDDDDGGSSSDGSLTSQETKLKNELSVYPLERQASLCCFGPSSRIRRCCAWVCANPLFEPLTMLLIFSSSLALALDSPLLNPQSQGRQVLDALDVLFNFYFLFEMTVKVVTFGAYFMPRAYLRDGFNCLDGVIVVCGMLSAYSPTSGGGGSEESESSFRSLRALRALRALRPLRIIKRFDALKIVVNSIINVVPDVMNVLLLCLLFFLMFGVIFVSNLKGRFNSCQGEVFEELVEGDPEGREQLLVYPKSWMRMDDAQRGWFSGGPSVAALGGGSPMGVNGGSTDYSLDPNADMCRHWPLEKEGGIRAVPTSKQLCLCFGAQWGETVPQNFNNIYYALFALYELSTTEGWVAVTQAAVDAREVDMQPVRDHNVGWAFVFLLFMVVGSFFFMNLFVGVLYERFVQAQSELQGKGNNGSGGGHGQGHGHNGNSAAGPKFLTPEQEEYFEAQRLSMKFKPLVTLVRSPNAVRSAAYGFVSNVKFELLVSGCIVANTVVMALTYYGENDTYGAVLEYCNLGFTLVFTLEACVKLTAFGSQYFLETWNVFDFTIVVGTLLGMLVVHLARSDDDGQQQGGGGGSGFLVALRAFRLARIIRLVQGAQVLRDMLNTLLFTVAGLINVFGLLFLLFFVYTVMGVQLFAKIEYNGALDEHANFRHFGTAMNTLFRFATGENWNGFMYDTSEKLPGCIPDPPYDKDVCGFNDGPGCLPLNGCGDQAIQPYLYSFCMVVFFVALNLFVGVILEAFQTAASKDKLFDVADMERFQARWGMYDGHATAFISTLDLLHLMQNMPEPWGFGKEVEATQFQVKQRIAKLDLPLYAPGNAVFYYDLFFALTASVIVDNERKKKLEELKEEARKQELERKAREWGELRVKKKEARRAKAKGKEVAAKKMRSRGKRARSASSALSSDGSSNNSEGEDSSSSEEEEEEETKSRHSSSSSSLSKKSARVSFRNKTNTDRSNDDDGEEEEVVEEEKESLSGDGGGGEGQRKSGDDFHGTHSLSVKMQKESLLKVDESVRGGKAGRMLKKMRKVVYKLCKRHAIRDHEGIRILTASDDYAARYIQMKWEYYKIRQRASQEHDKHHHQGHHHHEETQGLDEDQGDHMMGYGQGNGGGDAAAIRRHQQQQRQQQASFVSDWRVNAALHGGAAR